jgi:hypothetical protein
MTYNAIQPAVRAAADPELVSRLSERTEPFFGTLELVTVEGPVDFNFDGSITREDIRAIWTSMVRDLAGDVPVTPDQAGYADALLAHLVPEMHRLDLAATPNSDAERRLVVQLGGHAVRNRLPVVVAALKCRAAFAKAREFGRAALAIADDQALRTALRSMPINDPTIAALLMHAAMTDVEDPNRLVVAATGLAGGATDIAVMRSGFGPLLDAVLAHAQNQLPALRQTGPFADVDLVCRAIDRFHQLMRAITAYVELGPRSRWMSIAGGLTKRLSEMVEFRLREAPSDINQALRRREANDRLDSDRLLAALNGCYVLKTARDCRDSLALNTLIDQTWLQVGQAVELHLERNLASLRDHPDDPVAATRLEAAITMAGLRFGGEYAELMRKARDSAERRSA